MPRRALGLACAAAIAAFFAPALPAATRTWLNTSSASTTWDTASNWSSNAVPGVNAMNLDTAEMTANLTLNQTVTLTASRGISVLTIGDTGSPLFSYTIATGAFALNFAPGGNGRLTHSAGAGPVNISGSVVSQTSNGLNLTADALPANPLTISAVISGFGGLTKSGTGTVVLSGASTYSGVTSILAGTVRLGVNEALPNGGGFQFAGSGTLDLNGKTQSLNSIAGSGGTVAVNGGTLNITTGIGLNNTVSGTGTINLTGNSSTNVAIPFSGTLVINPNSGLALGGGQTLGASAIQFGGTNARMSLFAANLLNSQAAVSGTASGGRLFLNDNNQSIGSLAGDVSITLGTSAAVTLTVGGNDASTTYAGIIGDPSFGNGGALAKVGTGPLTLTGANGYTGGTTISAGTIKLSGSGTIGDRNGPLTLATAGTLDLGGTSPTVGKLTGTGKVTNSVAGSNSFFSVGADGGDATFGGLIADGAGIVYLDKINGGTLEFTTSQMFSGYTVADTGTILFTGSGSLYSNGTLANSIIVMNAGTVLRFGRDNTLGSHPSVPATVVSLRGARGENSGAYFTTLNNLDLSGGELRSNGGSSLKFPGFQLKGTVNVGGTQPSQITATTLYNAFNAIQLGNNAAGGTTTFQVTDATGDAAADLTISAVLQDGIDPGGVGPVASGLVKTEVGTLLLSGANTYSGGTTVSGGTLAVAATGTLGGNSGGITIGSAGTLDVSAFGSAGFPLASGRTLTNNGAITGTLAVSGTLQGTGTLGGGLTVNSGGLVTRNSGTLTISGDITNNGTIRITGGAVLDAGGATSFVNNGVIDLISAGAATTLPTITGTGIVLTASSVKVKTVARASYVDGTTGTTKIRVTLTIDGYDGHLYQLQRSASLGTATFQAVPGSSPQAGVTGSVLALTDEDASSGEVFYRVQLSP